MLKTGVPIKMVVVLEDSNKKSALLGFGLLQINDSQDWAFSFVDESGTKLLEFIARRDQPKQIAAPRSLKKSASVEGFA